MNDIMASTDILRRRTEIATREAINPLGAAAGVVASLSIDSDMVDTTALENALLQRFEAMKTGKNITALQEMLYGEALALNALFANLMLQAKTAEHHEKRKGLIELALKAQRQNRATVEVLANIIEPKPKTLIQNNRAEYQQVNNKSTNELLDSEE